MATKIIISDLVNDMVPVKRSWYQRLFTWPWLPFKKYTLKFTPRYRQLSDGSIMMSKRSYEHTVKLRQERDLDTAWENEDGQNYSQTSKYDC